MKWASSWSKFSFKGVGSFSQGVMDVRCGYGICCHGEEFQCLFPENVVQEIETPLFVTNTAYDSGQIKNAVAPGVVDPHGKWHDCKMDIEQCSSDQIEIIQEFRLEFIRALDGFFGTSSPRGMFINSCYAHCQTEIQETWYMSDSPMLSNKVNWASPFVLL
ncbi:pectin acetylesterase 8-like [Helianthus annuus]|uniref:pectin acetylesterase 8-like n=1 Tax=Helianthus annuus TaxID=4232 RepID=UPI001652F54C|nr:pectin acetylesterase 8-like [Helianthus annuus]